jgi:preprotein translocase SecE subunit
MAEMKQVAWPTQKQSFLYTALVIVISIIVSLYLGLFDFLFTHGVEFIVGRI